MSKKVYLFSLVLLALAFTACSETEEVGKYDNWRARSEAYIDSLQNVYDTEMDHGQLEYLVPQVNKDLKIFFKRKKKVTTGERPLYTDNVTCHVRLKLTNGDLLGQNFSGELPTDLDPVGTWQISNFWYNNQTNVTDGFMEILQNMREGERWEAYIPYQLGYGTADRTLSLIGNTSVVCPAYSTLIFDVQLEKIEK